MMDYAQFLIITLILLLKCIGVQCHDHARLSAVYHIKNATEVQCPEEPCLTLPQFATNVSVYLESNTSVSLIFLPGNHYLNLYINISTVSTFSMYSSSTNLSCCPTVISCEQNAGINISNVDTVYIGYMQFTGCHGHQAIAIKRFMLDSTTFMNHSGSAFQFIFSEANIADTSFISNSGGSLHNIPHELDLTAATFGNNLRYSETGAALAITQSNVTISHCVFEDNQAEIAGAMFVEKFSKVTILGTTFERNLAICHLICTSGVMYSGNSTVVIFNSTFYGNMLVDYNDPAPLRHIGGVFGLFESTFSAEHCIFARNGILIANSAPYRKYSWPAGVIIYAKSTLLNISNSAFKGNSDASSGEALFVLNAVCIVIKTKFSAVDDESVLTSQNSTIAIYESQFNDGTGGVLDINYTNITIKNSLFENNGGFTSGVMTISGNSNINIFECNFTKNSADAIIYSSSDDKVSITIIDSVYIENLAEFRGLIEIESTTSTTRNVGIIIIKNTKFIRNEIHFEGVLVCSECASMILISNCDFIGNIVFIGGALHVTNMNVTITGGIMERNHVHLSLIHAEQNASISINGTVIRNNVRNPVLYFLRSTGHFSHITIADNQGQSLVFALFSNVTFNTIAISNSNQHHFAAYKDGGAIVLVQSKIVFEGISVLKRNYAEKGGAIHAIESKIHMYGEITIADNTATKYGGGMYLHNSQLNCYSRCLLELIDNTAGDKGGGLYAISSYVSVENTGRVFFRENTAKYAGGGISLESSSKLYIIALTKINSPPYTLTFINNSADYGGAVFVADETNSGICASESFYILSTTTECFIQLLSVQDYFKPRINHHITTTFFADNHAYISGSNIFGGLLDRCTLSKFSRKLINHCQNIGGTVDGATYLTYISEINQFDSISSEPIRICFCRKDGQPDCSYHPQPISVSKGRLFTVPLVAVDQVNNTVPNATIRSFMLHGGLGEDQLHQNTGEGCTDLKFEVFSPYWTEQLILYADGPCKDAPLSQSTVEINFTSCNCPVGFQPNAAVETRCECECNSHLQPYILNCDPKTETITREGRFWLDFVTESGNYLIHPHCPFDYCRPSNEKIAINLNIEGGANVQCANNRSGILCGQCSPGTSLTIGNSHCIKCPTYWPLMTVVLLIATILAGILLVSLMLSLNLTVAVGTLNGVIFYANIVAANTNSVFPTNVIIAWLNLEPGINVCFFDGMTIYWKLWLQLVFPTYMIFLVALVILISGRSKRLSRLIGKKDPVATLATLVLLSYAKLLHTIIASLSGTVLKYPGMNDTHDNVVVWLPDASIKYLSAKHIPLFITAILILIASIAYTLLLFFWQWLLRFKLFNYAPKLSLFIRAYHAPYAPKHRYWTGLLLIVRIILYIIFAANVRGDPSINLIVIGVVVVSILMVKEFVESRGQLYQKRPIEMLEVACHFNLVILCIVTFFFLEDNAIKNIFAQISMSITVVLLLGVLLYHFVTEIMFNTKLWKRLTKGQGQWTRADMDTTILEGGNIPQPTHSVIEGPGNQQSTLLRGRKGGKMRKNIECPNELRMILLDEKDASYTD